MSVKGWWSQPVAATHWLNRSAGDWKPSVFLGRSLSWRATLFSWAWECAARSRALRVAEVDVDICFHAEPLVVGKFLAAIPGQGSGELVGQLPCLPDQCVDHGLRFPVRNLGEHHITRVAFDQCDDVAVLRSTEQVALPVARYGPILDRRRSLADRDSVRDAATLICLRRCVARAPDWPSGSQMLQQLFLQHAAGLHIKAAIDGLVRHAPRLNLWIY